MFTVYKYRPNASVVLHTFCKHEKKSTLKYF